MAKLIKFEIGKEYTMRSPGDYDCVWTFEVVKRTEKSIWVNGDGKENKRLLIDICSGVECVKPFGTYSMSPSLRANSIVENEANEQATEEKHSDLALAFFAKILA